MPLFLKIFFLSLSLLLIFLLSFQKAIILILIFILKLGSLRIFRVIAKLSGQPRNDSLSLRLCLNTESDRFLSFANESLCGLENALKVQTVYESTPDVHFFSSSSVFYMCNSSCSAKDM